MAKQIIVKSCGECPEYDKNCMNCNDNYDKISPDCLLPDAPERWYKGGYKPGGGGGMSKIDLAQDRQYSTEEMICPYCGETYCPEESELYDENLCEFECSGCGNIFNVKICVNWTWTTTRMPSPLVQGRGLKQC